MSHQEGARIGWRYLSPVAIDAVPFEEVQGLTGLGLRVVIAHQRSLVFQGGEFESWRPRSLGRRDPHTERKGLTMLREISRATDLASE